MSTRVDLALLMAGLRYPDSGFDKEKIKKSEMTKESLDNWILCQILLCPCLNVGYD